MPRRNRRDLATGGPGRKRSESLSLDEIAERLASPSAAQRDGYTVRRSTAADKRYKCPYCEGWIEPGISHVVAYPDGGLSERRHYHTGCWSKHTAGQKG